jgi:hypothetical protein
MISTPLDKCEADVYELAEHLANAIVLEYSKKKNRVMFLKEGKLLKALGIQEQKGIGLSTWTTPAPAR